MSKIETVHLPFIEYRSLQTTKVSSYDHTGPFEEMLAYFVMLDRTRYPTRRGGLITLTHESNLQTEAYNRITYLLVDAGFASAHGNYASGGDEGRYNKDFDRDMMLRDLVQLPGVGKNGQVIQMSDGLYTYFYRNTFTAPFETQIK